MSLGPLSQYRQRLGGQVKPQAYSRYIHINQEQNECGPFMITYSSNYIYYTVTCSHHQGVGTHHAKKIATVKEKQSLRKKKIRKISPLCPLSCKLVHKRTSSLQRLHIAVASCRGQGFIPWATPHALPLKPPQFTPILDHSPCLPRLSFFSLSLALMCADPSVSRFRL